MKSYSSREVIQLLKADGWYEVNCEGDHHQFKHPTKKGTCHRYTPQKRFPDKNTKEYCAASRNYT